MIYVVEGIDRAGKSTFIDKLRSIIVNPKVVVIHSGKPPKGVDPESWTLDYYANQISLYENLTDKGYDIILDRTWLGEVVYGPIYRNVHIPLTTLEFNEEFIRKNCILTLFIDSPENAISRDDGLSFSTNLEDKTYEIKAFRSAFEASVIERKFITDWSVISFSDEILSELAKYILELGSN